MKENYLRPVLISDVKLHGDFALSDPTISVLRVRNMKVVKYPQVVSCTDPKGFTEETGYEHTPELYIRSYLMLYAVSDYTVDEVEWVRENEACKQAIDENETLEERGMTFSYDGSFQNMFEPDITKHYEFDIPEEMLLVIPVDLNESHFQCLSKDQRAKVIDNLAWRQMLTTLPISNIREVPNE